MRFIVLMLTWMAGSYAVAETVPMTTQDFEAHVEGKTIHYSDFQGAYGIEQYLPNRRVVWSYMGQRCQYGKWYPNEAGQICFIYEDPGSVPQCWGVWREGDILNLLFNGDPSGTHIHETHQDGQPLPCYDPYIGS